MPWQTWGTGNLEGKAVIVLEIDQARLIAGALLAIAPDSREMQWFLRELADDLANAQPWKPENAS